MTDDRLAMRRGLDRPAPFTVGWHQAVFEHYRVVDEAAVACALPAGVTLDRHDGTAWISVVSFRMHDMRWRGWRLLLAHTYPQINVRTYVRSADHVGVFFLRNHVSNRLAALAGRLLYGVPYRYQTVRHTWSDDGPAQSEAALPGGLRHRVVGRRADRVTGHESDPTSLRFFLVERYPLYTRRRGHTWQAAMLHAPWELYRFEARERSHGCVADLGLLPAVVPFPEVHCSPGVTTMMWPATRLGSLPALVERPALPSETMMR